MAASLKLKELWHYREILYSSAGGISKSLQTDGAGRGMGDIQTVHDDGHV